MTEVSKKGIFVDSFIQDIVIFGHLYTQILQCGIFEILTCFLSKKLFS